MLFFFLVSAFTIQIFMKHHLLNRTAVIVKGPQFFKSKSLQENSNGPSKKLKLSFQKWTMMSGSQLKTLSNAFIFYFFFKRKKKKKDFGQSIKKSFTCLVSKENKWSEPSEGQTNKPVQWVLSCIHSTEDLASLITLGQMLCTALFPQVSFENLSRVTYTCQPRLSCFLVLISEKR